jgi:hypothetical protein
VRPNPNHPAPFSPLVLHELQVLVDRERRRLHRDPLVLDPFAGIGRIHDLRRCSTVGVEIEPEWAACRRDTIVGDATALPAEWKERFDVVATSPVFPNRMTDHHNARDASRRHGYRFSLGRMPSEGSSAVMAWGPAYRNLHRTAAAEMFRVLAPGGLVAVDMSDSYRTRPRHEREVIPAVEWWRQVLEDVGFSTVRVSGPIATPRLREGRNYEARVDGERIITGRKR